MAKTSEVLTWIYNKFLKAIRVTVALKYITYLKPVAKDIGINSTEIAAAKHNRNYLAIVNDSDTTIYIAIGATAVVGRGIRLNANGGSFEMTKDNLSYQIVNGIHGNSGTKQVTVQEAVE